MLQIPVGFAKTEVKVSKSPSASVDTPVLVINGGIVNVVWPFESVVETKTGFESVVAGFSVMVLVPVGVSALAC